MALDNDAYSRALMMAGLGMMGQPNVWQALSRGGMFGMQAYDQALNQKDKRAEEAQQRQMRQMQINQATQAYGDQQAERALAARSFAPGVSPLTPNDDNGNPMPSSPAGGGLAEYARGLFNISPKDAIALQQTLAKESPYGKIDPKDYTADSIRAFNAAGGHDFSLLRPRTKVEVHNGMAMDPFATAPGTPVTGPLADVIPDGKGGYMFNTAKINPLEKQRVGMEGSRLQLEKDKFNRGEFSTNVPLPGGNTGAGFVTPTGFTQAAGTGEKSDVPASIRTALAQNNVTLSNIDLALQGIQGNPAALGAKNYMGDAVRQRTNPEGVDVRALVADIGSQKIHDRTGANMTVGEAPRLQPFVPAVTDSPQVATMKLQSLRRQYAQMQEELSAGKSISQATGSRSPSGMQTPSIAEIQAELARRGAR